MKYNWKCKLGIHTWKDSELFNNAIPLYIRNELKSKIFICNKCFRTKIKEI